ncbi:hypothetical protein LOK49_LG02G03660 [Camellia lanceoleosa]|uniref:Uncharacterized protein n=1 Tax=Camellia lanceoleosa TaxID=1840588 RepID=A0ACC0IRQ6_9ERIC|nr:hypothetical protein LOK49_LG02G03660 [Camellia lanceoleosa]
MSKHRYYYTWPGYSLDVGLKAMYIDANVTKMLETYKGLDYVVVYVEKGVDPTMVLSSNGELLSDSNGAEQGDNAIGGDDTEQGGNAICGTDTDIIDINLSDIDIIVDDIGNDSDDITGVAEGKDVGMRVVIHNMRHTTDTESVEGNEADESDSAQSETQFLADEDRTDSDNSKDLDYIRCTTGQLSQPALTIILAPAPTPTPTPSTNIPSNETSSGIGKGPEITVGGRGRGRGPINAFASAVNVGRIGVNANVRGHAVSATSVLETIKARRLHKELAIGSK